ncbi:MAG TPA: LapA family protein [Candidatus Saccharimonadales bacterium]|nr:LapA family protein [Candidatus Saccharimonadales bacterium]
MVIKLIVGVIAALLFVILIAQNTNPVTVYFLMWRLSGSIALFLLIAFILGVIVSLLVAIPQFLKRKGGLKTT